MAFTYANEGEALLLGQLAGKVTPVNLKLKLFVNNMTPGQADTTAAYTEFGGSQGYSDITLTTSSWGSPVAGTGTGSAAGNRATINYAQQTFSFNGTGSAATVYGYYLTDAAGTTVIGGERFSTAKTAANNGDAIKITPQLSLGTLA